MPSFKLGSDAKLKHFTDKKLMTDLTETDVKWLKNSTLDPNGRLFWYKCNLFRAMKNYDADFYERLIQKVESNNILNHKLAGTKIANFSLSGATTTLEHKLIEPVLYPYEWSSLMFKDAALCHCDVHIELVKSGYNLQDAHLWNVLFNNYSPQFIDIGSIIKSDTLTSRRSLLNEYSLYMIYPLYLMQKGQSEKARKYLCSSQPSLDSRDIIGYFNFLEKLSFKTWIFSHLVGMRLGLMPMLKSIRRQIESFAPFREHSRWKDYHSYEFNKKEKNWHDKQNNIYELFNRLRPETVLDIGCATGWYSMLAAEAGAKVIAIDPDNEMINKVYEMSVEKNMSITASVKDIFRCKDEAKKVKSDMTLALALVHHLIFTQRLSFEEISKTLAACTKKYLITEFIDENDAFVKDRLTSEFAFYTLDNFISILGRHFKKIEKYSSSSQNRILLLCEK